MSRAEAFDMADVSQQMRTSRVFSTWRLVAALLLAFAVTLSDMFLLHIAGIETISELASETTILVIGLYGGFTIAALLGKSVV
jgi:hypothetical protein